MTTQARLESTEWVILIGFKINRIQMRSETAGTSICYRVKHEPPPSPTSVPTRVLARTPSPSTFPPLLNRLPALEGRASSTQTLVSTNFLIAGRVMNDGRHAQADRYKHRYPTLEHRKHGSPPRGGKRWGCEGGAVHHRSVREGSHDQWAGLSKFFVSLSSPCISSDMVNLPSSLTDADPAGFHRPILIVCT